MTNLPHLPAPTLTDRELPAQYGVCRDCGATPALFDPSRDDYFCSPCTQIHTLSAAAAHLEALALPVLASWAHHWGAVGLPQDHLAALLGGFTQEDQTDGAAQLLSEALAAHDVPSYSPAGPDRVLLDVENLPTVDGVTVHTGTYPRGRPYQHLHFTAHHPDGTTLSPAPGLLSRGRDAALFLNASAGDAVLFYLGIDGQTGPSDPFTPRAFRVRAPFLDQVREALGNWPDATPGVY
ncbi:hypothetical protein [Deinococcus sonorensis]|uniref:Uncharacterized protein n=2 Tax=Deinococcus sonorensis TaxID=309891 RepID=A0AAU7UCP9_9DEIO